MAFSVIQMVLQKAGYALASPELRGTPEVLSSLKEFWPESSALVAKRTSAGAVATFRRVKGSAADKSVLKAELGKSAQGA